MGPGFGPGLDNVNILRLPDKSKCVSAHLALILIKAEE